MNILQDVLQLSEEAAVALEMHKSESEIRLLNEIATFSQPINNNVFEFSDEMPSESWNLSQFWYDDDTIHYLSNLAYNLVGSEGKIALISAPSLYAGLKSIDCDIEVKLFEYDQRFRIYGADFIHYDFQRPFEIQSSTRWKYFDLVIMDPPYLSNDCLVKCALTATFLTKRKLLISTGEKMADSALKYLKAKPTDFVPTHRSHLNNPFRLYANFDITE